MATSRQVPQLALGTEQRTDVTDRSRTLGQIVSKDTNGHIHESMSMFLADLLARMYDIEPTEGAFQLYNYVDTDAIDALFDHAQTHDDASWRIELDVGEETVVIDSDGYVNLTH